MHSFLVTSVSIVQTGYPIMVALIDVWNSAIVFYLSRLYKAEFDPTLETCELCFGCLWLETMY